MSSCHSILECCVMFSGVKLSMGSFVLSLYIYSTHSIEHNSTTPPAMTKKDFYWQTLLAHAAYLCFMLNKIQRKRGSNINHYKISLFSVKYSTEIFLVAKTENFQMKHLPPSLHNQQKSQSCVQKTSVNLK